MCGLLRWQLYPAATSILLLLLSSLLFWPLQDQSGRANLAWLGWTSAALSVLAGLVAVLLLWLMPPFVDLTIGGSTPMCFAHVGYQDHEIEVSTEHLQEVATGPDQPVPRPCGGRFKLRIFYPAAGGPDGVARRKAGGLLAGDAADGGGDVPVFKAKYCEDKDWYAMSQVAGVPLPPFGKLTPTCHPTR